MSMNNYANSAYTLPLESIKHLIPEITYNVALKLITEEFDNFAAVELINKKLPNRCVKPVDILYLGDEDECYEDHIEKYEPYLIFDRDDLYDMKPTEKFANLLALVKPGNKPEYSRWVIWA